MGKSRITIARGDGIGPEIMDAALRILEAGGAQLEYEEINIGLSVYEKGVSSGIEKSAWESLARTRVFLKAPITTPMGGGVKSLNVTARKTLGLYANVRPCVSYDPVIRTRHPFMDVVIVRENEEDLYAGIEYQQTADVTRSIKVISRPGCEKIVRYAFEYARANSRKKVSCFVKDNIMKISDGLFRRVFEEIGAEYPEIEQDHWIIDIGTARLADSPEIFDVIVTPNLYGDIISDVAAEIAGSVGLAGSSNIGEDYAMFEAIHGSAPMLAGKNVANPSGLLGAALMMLSHIGQGSVAERIHNAWLATLENGFHTQDIYSHGHSKELVGTREFADAVIAHLGHEPKVLKPVHYQDAKRQSTTYKPSGNKPGNKRLDGIDLFFDWDPARGAGDWASSGTAAAAGTGAAASTAPDAVSASTGSAAHPAEVLAKAVQEALAAGGSNVLALDVISNRGMKVWPDPNPVTFLSDHWRLRFLFNEASAPKDQAGRAAEAAKLYSHIVARGFDCIGSENLYSFDGKRAYSLDQGA